MKISYRLKQIIVLYMSIKDDGFNFAYMQG